MENKEKIPDIENKETEDFKKESYPEVFPESEKKKEEGKDIENLKEEAYFSEEKEEKTEKEEENISKEEKEIIMKLKESQGASIGKISKIIEKVKKKFSPYGVDKYHDKLTEKKDDQ